MKILLIPDIHGNWNKTLNCISLHKDKVDKVIALGDYVDDFDEKSNGINMILGFKKLCEFKRKENEKFEILLGNHDLAYLIRDWKTSGYHHQYSIDYREMFEQNLDLMNIACEYDGYVFSHAGICSEFYNKFFLEYCKMKNLDFPKDTNPIERMNLALQNKLYDIFNYNNKLIDFGDGDSIGQSPLWIRPISLAKDSMYNNQIVGHTEVADVLKVGFGTQSILLTDSRTHDNYLIINTLDKTFIKIT